MDFAEFSNLIAKYRNGELSQREKEMLESFLDSFQMTPGDWVENEMGDRKVVEEEILARILKNIKRGGMHRPGASLFSPALFRRAAAIAFFIILSSGILYISGIFPHRTRPPVWLEEVTSAGHRSVMVLPDSSQVTLNADSKLRYPDRFRGRNREVYLEGEAYFVVRHASDRPFIVRTGNLSTTALGTKFNVSAYPESKTIAVSLLEGKVRVSCSEKGKAEGTVVLSPKEELLYDKANDISTTGPFDSLVAVGWKDEIYKFENAPMDKVISRLERAYGAKFIITDRQVLAQRITVTFERDPLQTVAEVMKSLTGLDYRIDGGEGKLQEVVFFRDSN